MEIKEVVKKAVEYINSFYGEEATSDFILEEVQRSEDDRKWLITLSFTRERPQSSSISAALSGGFKNWERVYKQIHIDADSGEFLSMTIRKV